jgi:hypothetical protein
MKPGHPRGGTVDGIRKESLVELAKLCDSSDDALSKYANKRGPEFDYHGHKIVMDPPSRKPRRMDDDEGEIPLRKVRGAPADPMIQVRKARRNYDERGIAKLGLLMRRPA